MARKRGSDRHPANLRSNAGSRGDAQARGHLRAVPDLLPILPTLIPDEEDEPLDELDVVMANLPMETLQMLWDSGRGVQDVIDGRVPGLDVDEIIADAQRDAPPAWTPG